MSMRALAIRGSLWTLGGYGLSQVIRLGSHLILAWLLAPEIFGLMALVKVFMQGLGMFSDVGIKPSIIQSKRGHDAAFLNTAWTIQIFRGLALWVCSCVLAWPVAAMFARNDEAAWALVYLLPVAGVASVIAGFNSTALATLNKDLRLGRLTTLEIASQIVSLSVIVVWAIVRPSVWAMIAGGLAANLFRMVVSHLIVPGHRVRMGWDRQSVRELFTFGRWIFLSTAFTFVAISMDKVILGNVLPLSDLGLYSISYVFVMVAFVVASRLGETVLFPVYAQHKHDPTRMMAIAIRARELVLWSGVATCTSMAIAAPAFFRVFWDDRYYGAAPIAQWIALYVWSMILLQTIDRIPLAMGNSRALFVSNLSRTLGIVFAAAGYPVAGLPGFIVGLALGPAFAHLYLLQHLPLDSRLVLLQSVRFTIGGLMFAVPAILVAAVARDYLHDAAWLAATCALSLAPIAVCAKHLWVRLRPTVRQAPCHNDGSGRRSALPIRVGEPAAADTF